MCDGVSWWGGEGCVDLLVDVDCIWGICFYWLVIWWLGLDSGFVCSGW